MKPILRLILSMTLISTSFQIDCGSYRDITCGYHTTKYTNKCQMISSTCQPIEVDDGCEITSTGKCQETSNIENGSKCYNFGYAYRCKKVKIDDGCEITSNFVCQGASSLADTEKCQFADLTKKNHCQKVTKTCTDYDDANCGTLKKIEGTKQCIQRKTNTRCSEIIVDDFCGIKDDSNKKCEPRDDNFDSKNYLCEENENNLGQTECKRRKKICSDNTSNCNAFNPKCYQLKYYKTCNEVEVDAKCKIDNSGDCVGDTEQNFDSDIEMCGLATEIEDGNFKLKCKLQRKQCSSITNGEKCSNGLIVGGTGFTCLKTGSNSCKEFLVNKACSISDSGDCQIKDKTATNKDCHFSDLDKTICRLYEVETNCKIETTYGTCGNDDGNAPDPEKICDMEIDDSNLYSNCKKRDKKCEDYKTQTDCDADTDLNKNDKKCSWDYSLGKCREYGIDNYCTVTNGKCKEVNAPPPGQVCLFDTHLKLNCKARAKTCTNYLDNCESTFPLKDNENTQCLQIDPIKMCKSVTIDENCRVNSTTYSDGTTSLSCVNRKDFPQNEGICAFDDEQEKNKCTLTQRKCTQYTDNTCESLSNCVYYNNACYETDSSCTVDNSGKCIPRSTLDKKEKCSFDSLRICKKVNKVCKDLDDSAEDKKCSIIERTSTEQCYKFTTASSSSSCSTITLDGNCYVNDDKCVKDPNGQLNEDKEICEFNNDKTICSKRAKTCADLDKQNCNTYEPEKMKLCFYFSELGTCKEIQLDDRCSMNENSECQGSNCKFNNDKTKCYYEENGSRNHLKIGQMILLVLLVFL